MGEYKTKKLMKTNNLNILSVSIMYMNVNISPNYQVLLWVLQNQQEMPLLSLLLVTPVVTSPL